MSKLVNPSLNSLTILLGAGSSIPAGYPSTSDLTEKVLQTETFYKHSDSQYYPVTGAANETLVSNTDEGQLLVYLKNEIEPSISYMYQRDLNYEDIYFAAQQVSDLNLGELDHPLLWPAIITLKQQFENCISQDEHRFIDAVYGLKKYIKDVVVRSLSEQTNSTNHFLSILRLFESEQFSEVSVGTLCHDTHFETILAENSISLCDGFEAPVHDIRRWNSELFAQSKFSILKLHGSINWFNFVPVNGNRWYENYLGSPLNFNSYGLGSAAQVETDNEGPRLLLGTFNKISEYSQGEFLELHYWFRYKLERSRKLLVCGYSFSDKGINNLIINWIYGNRGRRVFIVHPSPGQLRNSARSAISRKWDEWLESGITTIIDKSLENVGEDELVNIISAN